MPLLPEVVSVLRAVIGKRRAGPVFLREKLVGKTPRLVGGRTDLESVLRDRIVAERAKGGTLGRADQQALARKVWREAGEVKTDMVRKSFMRIMVSIGHPEVTCPKSWRHSFATLLQDANVDPLIRQQTLGHKPTNGNGLGMTSNYTHTCPKTQRQQIVQALRRWLASLQYATDRMQAR